jgi:hypothetical protein
MNARAEAVARLAGRCDARVLEPSPPTVTEGPWFADDPVGRAAPAATDLPRVSPVGGGGLRWADLIADDPDLEAWCSERWLAAYRRLGAAPSGLETTRAALHRLAEQVISPARARANGKIALRYTQGGFGTPFFAEDVQLRVVGDELIVQTVDGERRAQITTLAAMAKHVGSQHLPTSVLDDQRLTVDPAASAFLGDLFGFACSVLEELRAGTSDKLEPSRVQLWPEHFDLAFELGPEQDGQRAGYGASPGDERHAEPYLYVVPWSRVPDGPLWQAEHYRGAELPYADLLGADDQREAALDFYRARTAALTQR